MTEIELIKSVIDGVNEKVSLPFKPLKEYEDLIESLGYVQCDWNTNGWQIDFWQYFGKEENERGLFCLEGSLYYGKFKFRTLYEQEKQ
jgi:hypothetical protein